MQGTQKRSSLYTNPFSSSFQALEITKLCVLLLLRKHFLQSFLSSPVSQKPVGIHWDLLTHLLTMGRLLRREPAPESRSQKVVEINDVAGIVGSRLQKRWCKSRAITHTAELWERALTLTFSRKQGSDRKIWLLMGSKVRLSLKFYSFS